MSARGSADLADGEWHRLHPATPLLRGGVATVAILAIVIANLRERLIEWFIPPAPGGDGTAWCDDESGECFPSDPIAALWNSGYLLVAFAAIAVVLILVVGGSWLSWRMHSFRVTDELVEVKSGILFRVHRQGRLDRIQGINVARPLFARLFGAAKLEVTVAGQDANIQLAYLSGATADALRASILRLAAGRRKEPELVEPGSAGMRPSTGSPTSEESLLGRRLSEFTAPELDPALAVPESVVKMSAGRLIGSTLLSGALLWLIIPVVVIVVWAAAAISADRAAVAVPVVIGTLVPGIIAAGTFIVNRVVKSLRFSIAGTPDGVRVGYGLFSTSNETLPPGRIHSISISQPLLWRPADWWEVKVNRAGSSTAQGAAGRQNTSILPVGTRADAFRVLELLLPVLEDEPLHSLVVAGLGRGAPNDGYTVSPPRARALRWFSRRRNGFALEAAVVLLRRGAIWRELVIVPTARMQSVSIHQGPLLRALRLASVQAHTVTGPVGTRLGALDPADAQRFFLGGADAVVAAVAADRVQRWGAA